MSGLSPVEESASGYPVADVKTDLATMSTMELERLALMRGIAERRATQREAAAQLGLGLRQVERLYALA
jgi:hypothetical protein